MRRRGSRRTLLIGFASSVAALALLVPAGAGAAVPSGFLGLFPVGGPVLTEEELDTIAAAGVTTFRANFDWILIQPTAPTPDDESDSFKWGATDRLVGEAAERDIRVLATVESPPRWVTDSIFQPPLDSKGDKRAWQRFLRALVQRYGPEGEYWTTKFPADHPGAEAMPIATYQIWNEENGKNHWYPKPSPRKYAKLLRASRRAIKGQDPDARIMTGGMFGTPNGGEKPSMYSWKFLHKLYKRGAKRDFDVVAAHPYSPNMKGIKIQVKLMRAEMLEFKDRKTPMWITELGWETQGGGQPGPRLPLTTEKGQAAKLKKAIKLIVEHRREWRMKRVTWFTWRDSEGDGCHPCQSAGLFHEDLTPKPAWYQFVRLAGGRAAP